MTETISYMIGQRGRGKITISSSPNKCGVGIREVIYDPESNVSPLRGLEPVERDCRMIIGDFGAKESLADQLTFEEIFAIFPRVVTLTINGPVSCFSSLAEWRSLTCLNICVKTITNLHGIEYLDSLQTLRISYLKNYGGPEITSPVYLTPLNDLSLKCLIIESGGREIISDGVRLPELEHLMVKGDHENIVSGLVFPETCIVQHRIPLSF